MCKNLQNYRCLLIPFIINNRLIGKSCQKCTFSRSSLIFFLCPLSRLEIQCQALMEANVQRMLEVRVGIIPLASALPPMWLWVCIHALQQPFGKKGKKWSPWILKLCMHCIVCKAVSCPLLHFFWCSTLNRHSKNAAKCAMWKGGM